MSSTGQLDPEIRELLLEAVNDKKSMISKALEEPLGFGSASHRHGVRLSRSSAEEKLLQVAKEEASVWAMEAYKAQLVGSHDYSAILGRLNPDTATLPKSAQLPPLRGVSFVNEEALQSSSLVQLASLALTLWPRDENRILMGQALALDGDAVCARRILYEVARHSNRRLIRCLAYDNLGMAASGNGTEFYKASVESGGLVFGSLVNWFLGALNEGDTAIVKEQVLPRFAEIGPEHEPCVEDMLRIIQTGGETMDLYKPNKRRDQMVRALEPRLPDVARRFVHEV